MAKKPVAGVVFQQSIATVYTTVSQIIELNESGRGGKTFESTSFDSPQDGNGNIGEETAFNGIIAPGKASFTVFVDPTLSGHAQLLKAETTTQLWRIVFPASGGAARMFTSSVAETGTDYKLGDGLKMSFDLMLTGLVTDFATPY